MKDDSKPFLKARFLGARFGGKRLPISVLPELNVYIQLIHDLARHLFLLEHKDRHRAPKGFSSSFAPALTAVEEGSAVAVIERYCEPSLLPEDKDFFDRAHELIAETIIRVDRDENPPEDFPPEFFKRFNNFGKGLRDDESIELRPSSMLEGATYTRKVRKNLVLKHSDTYQQEIDVVGPVIETNVEKGQFLIRLEGAVSPIPVRYSEAEKQDVLLALSAHETMDVSFCGVATFDRFDRILRIENIRYLNIFQSLRPYRQRLEELHSLPDGWLDGEGLRPTELAMAAATNFRLVLETADLPVPFLYPTPEGGLRAEWSVEEKCLEATLCFEPDGHLSLMWTRPGDEGEEELESDDAGLRLLVRTLEKIGVVQGEL